MNTLLTLILLTQTGVSSTDTKPYKAFELPMGMVGSAVGGATAWAGYIIWELGSKAVLSDSLDQVLDIIGAAELFGLGYGLFIPLGTYTGVIGSAYLAGDLRPEWGAAVGAWLGSAASAPFAVMVLDTLTWPRAALAAGSTILLPALGSWLGYKLMPKRVPSAPDNPDEGKSLRFFELEPYFAFDARGVCAGLRVGF
ncbi:hypothetical protein GX441_07890 [bacterium]|nr:hypothetical protein [bacterium]